MQGHSSSRPAIKQLPQTNRPKPNTWRLRHRILQLELYIRRARDKKRKVSRRLYRDLCRSMRSLDRDERIYVTSWHHWGRYPLQICKRVWEKMIGSPYEPTPQIGRFECPKCEQRFMIGSRSVEKESAPIGRCLCRTCASRLRTQLRSELDNTNLAYARYGYWLRTMPYADYLKTRHWEIVRTRAIERACRSCQVCDSKELLAVHHRTYARRGRETSYDVIVLCKRCHEKFHDILPTEGTK